MAQIFKPSRQRGLILHIGAFLLTLAAVGFFVLQAYAQQQRGFFILYLILAIIVFLPIPVIAYRLFALVRSSYTIDREGVGIQWGLREVMIPMGEIEWVRLASDLVSELPSPPLAVQGAVLGAHVHPDLGHIEFIASDLSNLILIAKRDVIFAISPNDVHGFQNAFNRNAELGSIAPIEGLSANADFLISALLKNKLARTFMLLGIILSLVLLVTTSFIIPLRESVPLGFSPLDQTAESSSSERLLLLPVLSLLTLLIDISLGAYLYRKEGFKIASYITFASSLILPVFFLGLILFLVI